MKAVNIIILIAGSFYICGSFLIEKKEPEKVTYELQEEDFHSQRQKDTGDGITDGIASIGAIAEEKSLTGGAKKKGLIASRKEGKNHIYYPLLSQDEYQGTFVKKMVKDVFSGTPKSRATEKYTHNQCLPSLASFHYIC